MKDRGAIVYGRTELGQTVYDIYCSSMSAAEVVRRHKGISREFVLDQRRNHPLRKQALRNKRKRTSR